ncbi:hypothetical protein AZ20_0867 [Bordetella bronchiseptica E014]|nr:hypothetical protein AZ20_0867 [Bordetella bronchiseptica E014]
MSRAGFTRPEIIVRILHIVDIDKKQCAMNKKEAIQGTRRGRALDVGEDALFAGGNGGEGRGVGGRRRCAAGGAA